MLAAVKKAVATGKLKKIEGIVQEALDSGCHAGEILDAMTGAMDDIGQRFQAGELFIPEMLVSAKTMQKAMTVLRPLLQQGQEGRLGQCVIGTVKGDLHDIGKNLVAMMLESTGFEIIDLGVDASPEAFVEAVRSHPDCKIVGLSALLTTTMDSMGATVRALEEAGLRQRVKIMVGGAPVTDAFAAEITADAYTADAGAAAARAKELATGAFELTDEQLLDVSGGVSSEGALTSQNHVIHQVIIAGAPINNQNEPGKPMLNPDLANGIDSTDIGII